MRKTNQILNNQVFISINNFALKQKKSEEKSSDHDWRNAPLKIISGRNATLCLK
jgi:hypothetical protein